MAASSQTLPMVDGGWGVLQDPNTIWVGHHLGFRAGGLAAGSDRGPQVFERENHMYATLSNFLRERAMTTRSSLIAALRAMWGVRLLSLNVHLWPVLAGSWTQSPFSSSVVSDDDMHKLPASREARRATSAPMADTAPIVFARLSALGRVPSG